MTDHEYNIKCPDAEDLAYRYSEIGIAWRKNKNTGELARQFHTTPGVIKEAIRHHLNIYPEEV